jgi:hypothetical protein
MKEHVLLVILIPIEWKSEAGCRLLEIDVCSLICLGDTKCIFR